MKLDAIVIVNEKNETVWVRSGTYPLSAAAKALHELGRASRESPLYIGRSFVDENGKEQLFEIATPLALALHERPDALIEAARVEVWHARTLKLPFALPEQIDTSEYELAGVLLLEDDKNVLEQAFRLSNNIDSVWNPAKPTRSTSVGDILVVGRESGSSAFRVASMGFQEVVFA